MPGGREGLPQPRPGPHGQHQPLVGHLQELRADVGVAVQPPLQLQEREVQRAQQLGIGQVREGLLEIGDGLFRPEWCGSALFAGVGADAAYLTEHIIKHLDEGAAGEISLSVKGGRRF